MIQRLKLKLPMLLACLFLAGCAAVPPNNTENLCAVFIEQDEWFGDAQKASLKWGIPTSVIMAIMHQESHFVADAQPPRTWLLGFIPWFRPSSAYGYAQAKDETWDDYQSSAGSWWSDRDDFADAADFIGWYCALSHSKLNIATTDTKNLYLAYHEGRAGYLHKSYFKSPWLKKIADKVAVRAKQFQKQLDACEMVRS